MIVTRTEPINKTKYAVSIDGEFAFVLYKGELHKYGIAQDRELPPHVYEEIMENVLPKRAKLRCMNLLETPTSGTISFEGTVINDRKTDINAIRRQMGL